MAVWDGGDIFKPTPRLRDESLTRADDLKNLNND